MLSANMSLPIVPECTIAYLRTSVARKSLFLAETRLLSQPTEPLPAPHPVSNAYILADRLAVSIVPYGTVVHLSPLFGHSLCNPLVCLAPHLPAIIAWRQFILAAVRLIAPSGLAVNHARLNHRSRPQWWQVLEP